MGLASDGPDRIALTPDPFRPLASGHQLSARYRIESSLGQGSFARTYLATDLERRRSVAIKILDPAQVSDWKTLELFEREAEVLRSLRHHGIPEVFEAIRARVGDVDVHALVMEFVEGESLAGVIDSGRRLDRQAVMHFFTEMVGVLDYLHGRVPPILHRDIKPANVILRPDGSPALVDFGSVRSHLRPDGGSTIAGTYGYMPYEQYMGQATPASDLYALAATFLHLVTGTAPHRFMGDAGRIEVPAELPCGEPLTSILARLLRPAPNERFQNARAVRAAVFGAAEPARAVATTRSGGVAVVHRPAIALPAGPRSLTGETRALFHQVAPSTWRLMNATSKTNATPSVASGLLIGFLSFVTMGVLPLWFYGLSVGRKRRLRPFFERGLPTQATILGMELEDIGFQEKMTRVRFQFEVDGRIVRGSDSILPDIAERWEPGEQITVLYRPDANYDSVIVSTA